MKKVSIIVPVFNDGFMLEESLNSLRKQSYSNIEVICVDDKSEDNCVDIISSIALEDSRFKLIRHAENMSASQARKDGVLAASGDYIMFLDGDDLFYEYSVERALCAIEENNVDILQFGTSVINKGNMSQSRIDMNKRLLKPNLIKIEGDITEACFLKKKISFNIWNKIYKADVCKQAFNCIEDGKFYKAQDLYAFYSISNFAKSFFAIEDELYIYNFGLGVTGGDYIDFERFEKLVEQHKIPKAIARFNQKYNVNKNECLLKIDDNLFNECISKYFAQLLDCDKERGLIHLLDSFGADKVIEYLSSKYWYKRDYIGELFSDFKIFHESKSNIKNVALYYPNFSNGGAQRVTTEIANLLVEDYSVTLISDFESQDDNNEYFIKQNIKREYIPNLKESKVQNYKNRYYKLKEIIEKNNIELFITGLWIDPVTYWDILSLKLLNRNVKVIIHSHNTFSLPYKIQDQTSMDLLYRYKFTDGNVCLSKLDEKFISCFNSNCKYIPNPSFNKIKSVVNDRPATKNILWVGRISKEKNPEDSIKMMEYVLQEIPDAKLKILGDGSKDILANMQKLIEEKNLNNSVSLEGFQSDVDKYYNEASVVVCTSQYEGWCLVIHESLSHAIPVVTYDMPYLEFLRDDKGLCIVKQKDIYSMAKQVIKLLSDSEFYLQKSKEAKDKITQISNINIKKMWRGVINNIASPRTVTKDKDLSLILYYVSLFQHDAKKRFIDERQVNAKKILNIELLNKELNQKNIEQSKKIEELNTKNINASKTIDDLKKKLIKAELDIKTKSKTIKDLRGETILKLTKIDFIKKKYRWLLIRKILTLGLSDITNKKCSEVKKMLDDLMTSV